ncbi:DUF4357 domain-containing protein [Lacrimispora amygdalina]|uniref:DUF4357 domain-containing protein n=1 Tax=Lacrimispora amygdalina TaxID=253257 RepID=A0A3E2NFN1_9FIRM|nr:DUF4357 domain-containing protein [Clostridium indicum]RFZ79817.1 DUF4357 domain-containing protein [Clostridium indicum]
MRVYLKREKSGVNATGEYNAETKELTVLKGSTVCDRIAYSDKFRGANTVEKYRNETVNDGVVKKDITFKSASTAANFVTGSSTNGLVAWKDGNGKKLKEALAEIAEVK